MGLCLGRWVAWAKAPVEEGGANRPSQGGVESRLGRMREVGHARVLGRGSASTSWAGRKELG